jgi:hypothetical protein
MVGRASGKFIRVQRGGQAAVLCAALNHEQQSTFV